MAKKSKTRKQKILADSRKKAPPIIEKKVDLTTYSLPVTKITPAPVPTPRSELSAPITIATAPYTYLSSDLRKTLLLTFFIMTLQLIIKYLVKI